MAEESKVGEKALFFVLGGFVGARRERSHRTDSMGYGNSTEKVLPSS